MSSSGGDIGVGPGRRSSVDREVRVMNFSEFVAKRSFGLTEGSIYERLRRNPEVQFDPFISYASLIYNDGWAGVLERVHREYLDVGRREGLAMLATTATWRANQERIGQSQFRGRKVNQDNAAFLARLRASYGRQGPAIYIGGLTGPRGDAYAPAEALPAKEAENFHRPQVEALAEGEVDFLNAATLPALSEAQGIAKAMAATGIPYVLSFVIRRDGTLLDGVPLAEAIKTIDRTHPAPPAGYAVNCVYPTVFSDGLAALYRDSPVLVDRIVSFQANTSARDPRELDGLAELQTEHPETLAALMLDTYRKYGIPILGGCCGTDTSHIACIAAQFHSSARA